MHSLRETMKSTDETSAIIHGFNIYLGPGKHFRLWEGSLREKPREV